MQTEINEIKRLIRDIPDFPEKGVIFKDITPLLLKKIREFLESRWIKYQI